MSYAILALLWAAWCALHSAMISTTVTEYVKRRLDRGFRFYRLFFNVVAAVTLVPVILYDRSFHGPALLQWGGILRVVQGLLIGTSLFLFVAGWRHYDMAQLVGLRQARLENSARPIGDHGRLHTMGILGVTRHPWYLASMILIWSFDLSMADIVRNVVLTVYLIVGARLEERKLVLEFGDEYRDYQRRVSMLLPWKWLREGGGG
jgi:methanethiol S-methyltransferase